MSFDIIGINNEHFRVKHFQWQALCHAMKLADYDVPDEWQTKEGEGLSGQAQCDMLAGMLEQFLSRWDGNSLQWLDGIIRVNQAGKIVRPDMPDAQTPYHIQRKHIQAFADFLKRCGGFNIY